MITLEQFIKVVPYYQDYVIFCYNEISNSYIQVMESLYIDDYMDFMNNYGKWVVVNVEAGRAEILNICIESR